MFQVLLLLSFVLPPALLVAGVLTLATATTRGTPPPRRGRSLGTIALIAAGAAVLLWLLGFVGDGDSSIWNDMEAGERLATGGAIVLGLIAVGTQGWVVLHPQGSSGRVRCAGMRLAGGAMLALFIALCLAWLTETG